MSDGDVRLETTENVVVARMSGEVDLSNAEGLGSEVHRAVPDYSLGLVLDLTGVAYLDSAGIYVIYGLYQRLRERGQRLILVIPPAGQMHRTLSVTRLTEQIPITRTVEDAVQSLKGDTT